MTLKETSSSSSLRLPPLPPSPFPSPSSLLLLPSSYPILFPVLWMLRIILTLHSPKWINICNLWVTLTAQRNAIVKDIFVCELNTHNTTIQTLIRIWLKHANALPPYYRKGNKLNWWIDWLIDLLIDWISFHYFFQM